MINNGSGYIFRVSGLYNKKADKRNRLTDFSIKAQTLKNPKNPFSLGEFSMVKKKEEEDYIKIQLKKQGRVEEELVFPRTVYIESFYRDKPARREELDMFPVWVLN